MKGGFEFARFGEILVCGGLNFPGVLILTQEKPSSGVDYYITIRKQELQGNKNLNLHLSTLYTIYS